MGFTIVLFCFLALMFYLYNFYKSKDEVVLLPIFYSALVLYTVLGCLIFEFSKKTPFDLYSLISDSDIYEAAFVFHLAALCFYIGSKLVKEKSLKVNRHEIKLRYQKTVFILLVSLIVIYAYGYGFEPLIFREGYIDSSYERNKFILKLFFVLSPFVIVLIPLINKRIVKYTIYCVYFTVLFSASSRYIVMVPFLYIVGSYLKLGKLKSGIVSINVIIIFLSLLYVLQIRNNLHHGLMPNIQNLMSEGFDLSFLFYGLNYALSFSLFGLSYVISSNTFQHDPVAFSIGLSPLPGSFYDMTLLETQRMLGTSPMSALSILNLAGKHAVIMYFFFSGLAFSHFLKNLKGRSVFYYVVIGLFVLFVLFSVQYNLRGLSRFLYYSIASYIIFLFFAFLAKKLPKR